MLCIMLLVVCQSQLQLQPSAANWKAHAIIFTPKSCTDGWKKYLGKFFDGWTRRKIGYSFGSGAECSHSKIHHSESISGGGCKPVSRRPLPGGPVRCKESNSRSLRERVSFKSSSRQPLAGLLNAGFQQPITA